MKTLAPRVKRSNPQGGTTLIELMFACVILMTGLLAVTAVIGLAVGNNGRSKIDSTATMVAQSVLEQVGASKAGGGPLAMTDCAQPPTTWTISSSPGGAPLNDEGKIDFTAGTVTDYSMNYVVCSNGSQSSSATYDVRWNVQSVGTAAALITVGARPKDMGNGRFVFQLPVTLQLVVGGK